MVNCFSVSSERFLKDWHAESTTMNENIRSVLHQFSTATKFWTEKINKTIAGTLERISKHLAAKEKQDQQKIQR